MTGPNWYQCADGSWKPYDYGMDDGPRRWHSEDAEPSEGQSKVESEASMDMSDKPVQVGWNILEGWRTSARMYVNQLDGFLDGMRMEDVKVPRCIVETRQFMASLMEDIAFVQNKHETFRTMGEKDDVEEMSHARDSRLGDL